MFISRDTWYYEVIAAPREKRTSGSRQSCHAPEQTIFLKRPMGRVDRNGAHAFDVADLVPKWIVPLRVRDATTVEKL